MRQFLTENYVNALEKLCAWEDITAIIDPVKDFDTDWKMSKYITAASHLQMEKRGHEDILQKALEILKKDDKCEYPLEMTSIFLLKGKVREGSRWTEVCFI